MRYREPWYDSDNPTRVAAGASWRGGIWLILAVLFIGLIGCGIWAFHVVTSGVKGTGDVTRQNNDANNRIEAQATFQRLYGDIQGYPPKITRAKADAAANPTDAQSKQVLDGLQNLCTDAVNTYNADAGSTTMQQWRPADLPTQINEADYCEAK